jgi:hypothetical protein
VEEQLCAFALTAEKAAQTLDVGTLVAGSGWDNTNDRGILTAALQAMIDRGPGPVRATTVGRPTDASRAQLQRDGFSIGLTVLAPGTADDGSSRSMMVLLYSFDSAGKPVLGGMAAVDGAANRRAVLAGGPVAACDLGGGLPKTEQPCLPSQFHGLPGNPDATVAPIAPATGTGFSGAASGKDETLATLAVLAGAGALARVGVRRYRSR